MPQRFQNRAQAGRKLADALSYYADRPDVLVLGLPRGGIPVAFEVARRLHAPLDICLVRKLGVPGYEELAMGAIAPGGIRILNHSVIDKMDIGPAAIEAVAAREQQELARRERLYRGNRPLPQLRGRTVILVDDGLATGATVRAAIAAIGSQRPAAVVVAVAVASRETCDELMSEGTHCVCLLQPEPFYAIGLWYDDFAQTSDDEVRSLLAQADRDHEPTSEEIP